MNKLYLILIVHYIADFLLQTRWMGENKSKNMLAMSAHIFIYTLALSIFGLKFAVVNGFFHLLTDIFSSKLTTYFYGQKNMYGFWAIIGLDQLIHVLILVYTYEVLLV
jgi:hypothetical protein